MSDTLIVAAMCLVASLLNTAVCGYFLYITQRANQRLTNALLSRDNQEYKDLNAHDLRLESQKKQPKSGYIKRHDELIPLESMQSEDWDRLQKQS